MKRLKRSISFLIAFVLCLSLLPVGALAANGDFVIEDGVLIQYNGTGGNVAIPDGVTKIGDSAFADHEGLTGVTIPNTVTSIGILAFNDATNLAQITIPNSVKSIGIQAFGHCTSLRSIMIPESVTRIDESMFSGCTGLTSVTLPDSVTFIGRYAFKDCSALTNITLPARITSIEESVFSGCSSLTSISIPKSATSIGEDAFKNCKALKTVTIPEGVTSIGKGAFAGCYELASVTIPHSVSYIGGNVFGHVTMIHGAAGSAAAEYAKNYDIAFTETPSTWAELQTNAAIAANLVPQALQVNYKQAMTRAEFCALAVSLYETATGAEITGRQTFADTTDGNVEKMAALHVVNGVGGNKFAPDDPLTREQAATMLARLADAIGKPLTKQTATFADNGKVATWALDAVGQMQATGIMGGVGNNTFAPKGEYTREQSIVTILRLYDIIK